jgi:UDP:flavonoid glycosyltransferase YjiC (YdhE family)
VGDDALKIILSPVGSAGDVHPMIGLALALRRRGHQVTFVTSAYFSQTLAELGLEHVELGTKEDFLRLAQHPDLWQPVKSFAYICRHGISQLLRPQYEIIAERFEPGRTLVVSSCLGFGARIAQEKLGVPLVTVHLQPSVMWSEHQSPVLPGMYSGRLAPRWLKRWQFRLGESLLIDPVVREVTGPFREQLGLPPVRQTLRWWNSPQLVLGLFPRWYAPPQPDWPPNVVLTQFPLWDESELATLSADVEAFLQNGDPPIVFTPGSAMMHGHSFFQAAVRACRQLGRRGMLLTKFHQQIPRRLPSNVGHFPYAPFSCLLPRTAALVHHGGIGSTAQALAAGVPQLIMPMAHDQPDNAARVKRLGVGDWLRPRAFRGPAVARRLARLLDNELVQRNSVVVARRFVGVDPLREACEAIEGAKEG